MARTVELRRGLKQKKIAKILKSAIESCRGPGHIWDATKIKLRWENHKKVGLVLRTWVCFSF
jgi:hypothetical protein